MSVNNKKKSALRKTNKFKVLINKHIPNKRILAVIVLGSYALGLLVGFIIIVL